MPAKVLEEFLVETIEPNFIIGDDILDAMGIMAITGATSVGKSFLAIQLGLDLASGQAFFGFDVPSKQRVLYMQAEMSDYRLQKRLRKLQRAFDGKIEGRFWKETTYDIQLDTAVGLRRLCEEIHAVQPDVLIIDPMRPFFEGDENKSESVEAFWRSIRKAQEYAPFALILVHHWRKVGADGFRSGDGIQESRGSGVLSDRPDTAMSLTKKGGTYKISWDKTRHRDYLPEDVEIVVDYETGLFVPVGLADSQEVSTEAVMELLGEREVRLSKVKDRLQTEMKLNLRTIERKLKKMGQQGLVMTRPDPENRTYQLIRKV